jgi:CRISPR/Cas system CMR-associated protein Cmr5 small subunit
MSIQNIMAEAPRIIILILMAAIGVFSLQLSNLLNQRIRPLSEKLARLHQEGAVHDDLSSDLQACRLRYEALLHNVDDVDTAEFSAGFIETLNLRFMGRYVTAATVQSWVRQAPSILISLGLLGTFAGLTVGLQQIGGILSKSLSPDEAMKALSALMTPMSTAFETSLVGLSFSLIVLIWTQISGTRTCLESCESLLSSWLETVLPRQIGVKVMTPLRQSLKDLNTTVKQLPAVLSAAVDAGMQEAFGEKLNELFDVQSILASEAATAVRSLCGFASTLNESGQDFLDAAQAFRQSNFATTLASSAQSLLETREQLNSSTESLSNRLFEVRDSLMSTQAEWKLLAKIAEQELEVSRQAREHMLQEIQKLHSAAKSLQQSTLASTESTKELREARLEVMRDRKLAIKTVEAVQQRLATDNSTVESCRAFASTLESVLVNWNTNVVRLNDLSASFVASVKNAKLEDEANIVERSRLATALIDELQGKMLKDLSESIDAQRLAIASLGEPTSSARLAVHSLLLQLEELQASVSRFIVSDNLPRQHSDLGD